MSSALSDVTIAHLSLRLEDQPQDFDRVLTATEREHVVGVRASRKAAFLTGRYLARKTIAQVCNVALDEVDIYTSSTGKPYGVANGQQVGLSISHDRHFAACAVSDRYQLGIDIEAIKRQPIKITSWPLVFTEGEQSYLSTLEPNKRDALSLFWWCLKEAAFKNSGQGTFSQLDCSATQQISNEVVSIQGIPASWQLSNVPEIPSHYLILCISS